MHSGCLYKIGFFKQTDFPAMVLRLFAAYLALMRRLQKTYMLEPAGSHGVWGLDDYHCLPFYFGSAQLIGETFTTDDTCPMLLCMHLTAA